MSSLAELFRFMQPLSWQQDDMLHAVSTCILPALEGRSLPHPTFLHGGVRYSWEPVTSALQKRQLSRLGEANRRLGRRWATAAMIYIPRT
jgi:hypothetical protein